MTCSLCPLSHILPEGQKTSVCLMSPLKVAEHYMQEISASASTKPSVQCVVDSPKGRELGHPQP